MNAFRIVCAFAVLLCGCNKEKDGIADRDPVSNALKQNVDKKDQPGASEMRKKLRSLANSKERTDLIAADFRDVAKQVGLDFQLYRDDVPDRFFFPEVMGSGLAWVDYDLDGWWDLYAGNGDEIEETSNGKSKDNRNQVFRNLAGHFQNETGSVSDEGDRFTQGIAVGDLDRDGFADLVISNYGENYLLINQGDGTFRKDRLRTDSKEKGDVWSSSVICVDLDRDDDLDLVFVNYVDWTPENHHPCVYEGVNGYCGPGTYAATEEHVFENLGDGSFRESHDRFGFTEKSKGLVVCAADFDQDQRPEIYIGSDLTENIFYAYDPATKKYRSAGRQAGLAVSKNGIAEATMGFAVKDFDGNGLLDLFLTHYYQDKNTLYLNRGGLNFADASYESRIKALSFDSIGFGTVPIDYDCDGDPDLFITNGHVLGETIPPFRFQPQLLNNDQCRFFDVSAKAGGYFSTKWVGRSAAGCDFDNDGSVDIAVGNLDTPLVLLKNQTKSTNQFLQLQLIDFQRRDLVGTEVTVSAGEWNSVQQVVAGESYLSSSSSRIHFGTGKNTTVAVKIKWPWGEVDLFEKLVTNSSWIVNPGGVVAPSSHGTSHGAHEKEGHTR